MSDQTIRILEGLGRRLEQMGPELMSPVEARLWGIVSVLVGTLSIERRSEHAPARPAVPDGWKLVPVEPTYEMNEAGIASLGEDDDRDPGGVVYDAYRAMLAAAPQPPLTDA